MRQYQSTELSTDIQYKTLSNESDNLIHSFKKGTQFDRQKRIIFTNLY